MAASSILCWRNCPAKSQKTRMTRNLIISGGIYHPFDETSMALAALMDPLGVQSTISEDIEGALQNLDDYDLVTMNCIRWRMIQNEKYVPFRDEWAMELSDAGRTALHDHVHKGGGLLGMHTASICFDTWPEWKDLLGVMWQWGRSHHPEISDITVDVAPDAHPIVAGIEGFELFDEIYHHLAPADAAPGLMFAEADEGRQPLMWARDIGKGRVVYDSLGHDAASITHPTHQRILQRSVLWALGRDSELEAI
jgi:type 1 glutamine amidotransferase